MASTNANEDTAASLKRPQARRARSDRRAEVAAGAVLDGPVHVRVHAGGTAMLPRLALRAGAGAEVTLVEANYGYRRGHNLKATMEWYDPDSDVSEDEQNRLSIVWEY